MIETGSEWGGVTKKHGRCRTIHFDKVRPSLRAIKLVLYAFIFNHIKEAFSKGANKGRPPCCKHLQKKADIVFFKP